MAKEHLLLLDDSFINGTVGMLLLQFAHHLIELWLSLLISLWKTCLSLEMFWKMVM